jgi:hypothetical protein
LLENLPFVPLEQDKAEVFFCKEQRQFISTDTLSLKNVLSDGE